MRLYSGGAGAVVPPGMGGRVFFLQCELPTTVDSHVGPSLLLKHCFNNVISNNFVYFIMTSLEVVEREGVSFVGRLDQCFGPCAMCRRT